MISGISRRSGRASRFSWCVRVVHSAASFNSRAEEEHEPGRMLAVERLDCRRRGVQSEIRAEAGLQVRDDLEVANFTLYSTPSAIKPFYGDRKSTRLNSSHVRISYAVFCLKKK